MKNKMKYLIATGVLVAGCAGLKSVKSEAALRGRILGIFSSCTTCMRGNGKSPIKNLKISSNLKENARVSAISKPLVGENSSNFDTSKIKNVISKNYYHQTIGGNGDTITLVSKDKPKVKEINNDGNGSVVTRYVNEKGEKKTLITPGLPIWVKGSALPTNDGLK